MRPLTPFLISLALFSVVPRPFLRADTKASVAGPAASPVAQVFDSIARQLKDHFNTEGTLTLEAQRPWNPPLAEGPLTTTIVEFPKDLMSSVMVRVRVAAGGEVLTEPTLLLRAQLMREVYVTKANVDREALFDTSLFETRVIDVLRERDPVSTTESLGDMVFTRSITGGRVLQKTDLARRPLIRRGDLCEVAAIDGSMTIVLRAMAMENGSAGDVVKVRNVETRKEFSAMVVATNRAEIRF